MKEIKKYILITSAHNEEKLIQKTIDSVVSQTVKPCNWLIVSDGSTDKTDVIVKRAAQKYKYITFIRRDRVEIRSFGQKVKSINCAYNKINNNSYSFIGILDADITFSKNYFENLIKEFDRDSNLGIAGGLIYEVKKDGISPQNISENSVAGAVQMYRKSLYEELGGFLPLENGGEDAAREIIAREKGWKTKTVKNLKAYHHGYNREGAKRIFYTKYRWGLMFYELGYSPVFMIFRSLNQIKEYPYIISAAGEFVGYFVSVILLKPKKLKYRTIKYLRNEQKNRIMSYIRFVRK